MTPRQQRRVFQHYPPEAVISEIARAAGIHVSQLRWRKDLCRIEERKRPEKPPLKFPSTPEVTSLIPSLLTSSGMNYGPHGDFDGRRASARLV